MTSHEQLTGGCNRAERRKSIPAEFNSKLNINLKVFDEGVQNDGNINDNSIGNFQEVYLELLEHQRNLLNKMNYRAGFDEDLIRKYL